MKRRKIKRLMAGLGIMLSLSMTSINIFAAEMNWTYNSETKTVSVKGYGMINDASELTKYLKDAKKITVLPGVTKTDKNVFTNLGSIEEVELPDGFLSIGNNSFSLSHNLKKINLPDSLVSIGSEAFMGCASLGNLTIPKNVTEIGVNAFANCSSMTQFSVSEENNSYVSVDGVIFTKDKKELVMYPPGRHDEEYRIPDGTEVIREKAFSYNSNLTKVDLPRSVSEIGNYAFYFCDVLDEIEFSSESGLKSIGDYAFYGCKVRSLYIPYGVETVGKDAFKNCDTLTYIDFPGTVTKIGDNALYGVSGLIKTGGFGGAAFDFAAGAGLPFSETVRVKINGREISFDVPAVVRDGCTMVPMRKIFEELGAEVSWNDETQTATGEKNGIVCTFTIGDNVLYKNGEATELLAPAILENDRTLVHVRAIAEAFGAEVDWNGETGLVIIEN